MHTKLKKAEHTRRTVLEAAVTNIQKRNEINAKFWMKLDLVAELHDEFSESGNNVCSSAMLEKIGSLKNQFPKLEAEASEEQKAIFESLGLRLIIFRDLIV